MRDRTRVAALGFVVLLVLTGCVPSEETPLPSGTPSPSPSVVASPAPSEPQDGDPQEVPLSSEIDATVVNAAVAVDASTVSASGYVSGLLEDGGTCEFVFEGAGAGSVSVVTEGFADRATTMCPSAVEPFESFTRGTWTVSLKYTSVSGGSVASEPFVLEIP